MPRIYNFTQHSLEIAILCPCTREKSYMHGAHRPRQICVAVVPIGSDRDGAQPGHCRKTQMANRAGRWCPQIVPQGYSMVKDLGAMLNHDAPHNVIFVVSWAPFSAARPPKSRRRVGCGLLAPSGTQIPHLIISVDP